MVIPLIVPQYECSAGFYTLGRRNSHLVPQNIGPGDGISSELEPHIHTGYVWPFLFLSDTCHKWDCCLVPVWRGAHWGDSVPWAVPPPIVAGLTHQDKLVLFLTRECKVGFCSLPLFLKSTMELFQCNFQCVCLQGALKMNLEWTVLTAPVCKSGCRAWTMKHLH
jgi:hypothetical protein